MIDPIPPPAGFLFDFVKPYAEVPGLFVLPAGHQEHYPADVLGSVVMSDLLAKMKKSSCWLLRNEPMAG